MERLPLAIFAISGIWAAIFHYQIPMRQFFSSDGLMQLMYAGWTITTFIGCIIYIKIRKKNLYISKIITLCISIYPILSTIGFGLVLAMIYCRD